MRFVDQTLRDNLLDRIEDVAGWFDPVVRIMDRRDPTGNKYLELAIAANASAIVTGDKDLLILNPWRGIITLGPALFVALA